ncbi:MAG: hypothetical protein HUK24_01875, partial [Sphaerochaetaceae bacterium]|nr:hypothetical protein [Sphaerochaetaceae bacterium]
PDYSNALAGKVFQTAEEYLKITKNYPKVSKYIHYYNPDLQGPLPLCEALWGYELYLDLYDEIELVEDALDYFTDLYIDFTKKWHSLCPPIDAEHSIEWGCLHKGHTIIRNDAAMNISGDMYCNLVKPRDEKIIKVLGGGIHFCGKGDHYIKHVGDIEGLSCVNMSQPELNNMDTIYANTIDKDIIIFAMLTTEVDRAVSAGIDLKGRVSAGASTAAWIKTSN